MIVIPETCGISGASPCFPPPVFYIVLAGGPRRPSDFRQDITPLITQKLNFLGIFFIFFLFQNNLHFLYLLIM